MNHIMIDGYHGNESRLDDIKTVGSMLSEMVLALNLKAVMPPFLLPYYYAKESEDDGISAFTILEGGHITVHTFPQRGCVFVDVMYDGYFDEDKLKGILKTAFRCAPPNSIRTVREYLDTTIDEKRIWRGGEAVRRDFGPHTIAKIEDVDVTFEQIYDMLDKLPGDINMLPICRPYVVKSNIKNALYYSGVVLIAQSHISFHYNTRERTLFCDAFSCSFYKSENFVEHLKSRFGEVSHMTIIRGSKHEQNISDRAEKVKRLSEWMKNCTE